MEGKKVKGTPITIKKRESVLWKLWPVIFPGVIMERTWITFNKTIWHPGFLPSDILQHELLHTQQQKNFFYAIYWWIRHFCDKKFRLSQELPAYKLQMQELFRMNKDRNRQVRIKQEIAKILSGATYGNMISYEEAIKNL